jgi:hypothetical protein
MSTIDEKWDLIGKFHDVIFSYIGGYKTLTVKVDEKQNPIKIEIICCNIDENKFNEFIEPHKNSITKELNLSYEIKFHRILVMNLAGYIGCIKIEETDKLILERITSSNMKDTKVGSISKKSKISLADELKLDKNYMSKFFKKS